MVDDWLKIGRMKEATTRDGENNNEGASRTLHLATDPLKTGIVGKMFKRGSVHRRATFIVNENRRAAVTEC